VCGTRVNKEQDLGMGNADRSTTLTTAGGSKSGLGEGRQVRPEMLRAPGEIIYGCIFTSSYIKLCVYSIFVSSSVLHLHTGISPNSVK
jgi:hypothetical protein